MASTGTLRAAYTAITDRLQDDTDFRNYFAQFDLERETEKIQFPYCRIALEEFRTEGSRAQTTEQPDLIFAVRIEINCTDPAKRALELLNAIEIFINAYDGSDITFSSKVLRSAKTFGDFEQVDKNIFGTNGEIEIMLQQYQIGGL